MELRDGLHRVEVPLGDRYVCSYIWVGETNGLIVDSGIAGSPHDHIWPAFEAAGGQRDQVKFAVTTHADMDHLGGNGDLDELPALSFACHRLDRELIEDVELLISKRYRQFEADHGIVDADAVYEWMRENTRTAPISLELNGGERFRLGGGLCLEVLHTPGHSKGHISLYDPRDGVAIVADSVLGAFVPTADGRPALPPTYRDVADYRATIQLLVRLKPNMLLTGHYGVLEGPAVSAFLEDSQSFTERLELELIATLEAHTDGLSANELIEVLSPRLGDWPDETKDMLAFPLVGHIEHLEQTGRLMQDHVDGHLRSRLVKGA